MYGVFEELAGLGHDVRAAIRALKHNVDNPRLPYDASKGWANQTVDRVRTARTALCHLTTATATLDADGNDTRDTDDPDGAAGWLASIVARCEHVHAANAQHLATIERQLAQYGYTPSGASGFAASAAAAATPSFKRVTAQQQPHGSVLKSALKKPKPVVVLLDGDTENVAPAPANAHSTAADNATTPSKLHNPFVSPIGSSRIPRAADQSAAKPQQPKAQFTTPARGGRVGAGTAAAAAAAPAPPRTPSLRDFGISAETLALLEGHSTASRRQLFAPAPAAGVDGDTASIASGGATSAAAPTATIPAARAGTLGDLMSPPPLPAYTSMSCAADPDHALHHHFGDFESAAGPHTGSLGALSAAGYGAAAGHTTAIASSEATASQPQQPPMRSAVKSVPRSVARPSVRPGVDLMSPPPLPAAMAARTAHYSQARTAVLPRAAAFDDPVAADQHWAALNAPDATASLPAATTAAIAPTTAATHTAAADEAAYLAAAEPPQQHTTMGDLASPPPLPASMAHYAAAGNSTAAVPAVQTVSSLTAASASSSSSSSSAVASAAMSSRASMGGAEDTANFQLYSVFPRPKPPARNPIVAAPQPVAPAPAPAPVPAPASVPTVAVASVTVPAVVTATAAASSVQTPSKATQARTPFSKRKPRSALLLTASAAKPAVSAPAPVPVPAPVVVAPAPALALAPVAVAPVAAMAPSVAAAAPAAAVAPVASASTTTPSYGSEIRAVTAHELATQTPAYLQHGVPLADLNAYVSTLNNHLAQPHACHPLTGVPALTKQGVVDLLGPKGKLALVLLLHLKRLAPCTTSHNSDVTYVVV